jgi:WD40 repeat protein
MLDDVLVLSVGIESYGSAYPSLHGPASNAARFARWAIEHGIHPRNVVAALSCLNDEEPDVGGACRVEAEASVIETELGRAAGYGTLVMYWCGHGALVEGHRTLLTAAAPESRSTYLDIDNLRAYLNRRPFARTRKQIFFVDACASLAPRLGVRHHLYDLQSPHTRALPGLTRWGLYSAAEGQPAQLDADGTVFSNTLFDWLESRPRDDSPLSDLETLADTINRSYQQAEDGRRLRQDIEFRVERPGALRLLGTWDNSYRRGIAQQLEDEQKDDLSGPLSSGITTFRGLDRSKGRGKALADLTSWLARPSAELRIVTGEPESGKTALLGALAVAASPLRHTVGFAHDLGLPPRAFDASIVATNRPTRRLLAHIARAAGLEETVVAEIDSSHHSLRWAVDLLLELPVAEPKTVLIDAVDEAADPEHLCQDVLARLINGDAGIRFLLGARPNVVELLRESLTHGLSDAAIVDLDEEYADPAALREAVQDALNRVEVDGRRVWNEDRSQYDFVADTIAEVAGNCFGVARTLAAAQEDIDATTRLDWPQRLPVEAGEAHYQGLTRRFGPGAEQRVVGLLLPLAYARGEGLPYEDLVQLVPALGGSGEPGRDEIHELLRGPTSYVESRLIGTDTVYRIRFDSLTGYLRKDRAAPADEAAITRCLVAAVIARRRGWRDARVSRYVRTHLIEHAVCAQDHQLGELLTDGGFLLVADPAQVLTHCARIEDGPLRAALAAYRDALPPASGDPQQDAARLLFAARCRRVDRLAESLQPLVSGAGAPSTVWTAWRQETPHRRLSTRPHHTRQLAAVSTATRAALVSASGDDLCFWSLATETESPAARFNVRVNCLTVEAGGEHPLTVVATSEALSVRHGVTGECEPGEDFALSSPPCALATAWLADRLVAVVGDAEGAVRRLEWSKSCWSERGGRERVHSRAITALAVVGAGTDARVVSASVDGSVHCWRYLSPHLVERYSGHSRIVRALVATERVDDDGDRHAVIASAGEDGIAWIWDPAKPSERGLQLTGHDGWIRALAQVQLGGRRLLLSGGDDGRVMVWDVNTGTRVGAPYRGHSDRVNALAAAELDGRVTVASAGARGAIRIWELAEAGPVGEPFHGHSGPVRALGVIAGPPDMERLVSAGSDGAVVLWDGRSGLPLGRPGAHGAGWVGTVLVSGAPDDPQVTTGGADGKVLIARATWAGLQPAQPPLADQLGGWISALAGDGDHVLWARCAVRRSGGEPTVIWRTTASDSEPPDPLYLGHRDWVRAIATLDLVGAEGSRRVVVSAGGDPELHVWDARTGEEITRVATGACGDIRALAVAVDDEGPLVLGAGDDGWIRPFRPGSSPESAWQQGTPWKAGADGVHALVVPADQPGVVLSAGADGWVSSWAADPSADHDVESSRLARHAGPVRSLAIGRRAGRTVVYSGSDEAAIGAWYLDDGRPVLPAHSDWVRSVSAGVCDAGPVAVSASDDGTLCAWDLTNGIQLWKASHAHGRSVRAVACLGVGSNAVVVSGSTAGDLRVWNLADGTMLCSPAERHDDWVRCLAVMDRVLASGGGDGVIRIWEWDGSLLQPVGSPYRADDDPRWIRTIALASGPDGWRVATSDDDGRLLITGIGGPASSSFCLATPTRTRGVAMVQYGGEIHTVFGDQNGRVCAWNPGDGRAHHLLTVNGEITALTAHDGAAGEFDLRARLAVASGRQISTWSWIESEQIWRPDWKLAVGAEVLSLAFSPDADRLVLGTRMGVAVVTAG